jgi:murein DD-endopeptidase MepM/ murein hydrolase activator NlpD
MTRRLTIIAAVVSLVLFVAAQTLVFDFRDTLFTTHTPPEPAPEVPEPLLAEATPPPPPAPVVFGIATDSLVVVEGTIQKGQTLSSLLADYNIAPATISELTAQTPKKSGLQHFRQNTRYTLLHTTDASPTARYFIYEPNELEYVVLDLGTEAKVTHHQREVTRVERELVGQIRGSLYESVLKAGGTASLVNKLADIYAWRLNLNHIRPGDTFKLIVEEKQVNGRTIEQGQLKAALIEHKGQPLYAIGLEHSRGISYYDQDGKSYKKAFLKEPVEYSRISSRYTQSRFHPVQKIYKAHLGTDFAAPTGTPIRSVGEGVVLEAGQTAGNGNYVKIKHNGTFSTQYLHMSRFAKGIRRGSRVAMGQTIGYVGSTGLSSGPHLCYRLWKNGQQVDALKVKLPLAEPVSKEQLSAFRQVKEQVMDRMEAMDLHGRRPTLLASNQSEVEPSI